MFEDMTLLQIKIKILLHVYVAFVLLLLYHADNT